MISKMVLIEQVSGKIKVFALMERVNHSVSIENYENRPGIVPIIRELPKARRGQKVILEVFNRRGGAPSGAAAVITRGMEG